jgi:hypothetical protein
MEPPAWFKSFQKDDKEFKARDTEFKARLIARLDDMQSSIRDLQSTLNPFADDEIFNVPVVGAERHELIDPMKRATYTWINYLNNENTVVGAAHCALSCHTVPALGASSSSHAVFIELPESVLKLGVVGIYLIEPYSRSFTNPLPVEKDLVVVKVKSSPPTNTNIPTFTTLSPQKRKNSRTSRVVGRGLGSAVSSFDGSVCLETNQHSGGSMRFLIGRGEPGDSGALLFVKDGNGNFSPLAVFRGFEPSLGPNYHKRGQGTILPKLNALTFLPVIDAQHLQHLVSTGVVLGDGLVGPVHFQVAPNPIQVAPNPNGIVSLQHGSSSFSGVFVKATAPINYAGFADISVMRGQK